MHGFSAEFQHVRPCAEDPDTLTVEGTFSVPAAGIADYLRGQGCTVVAMANGASYVIRRPGRYLLLMARDGNVTATRVSVISDLMRDISEALESTFRSREESQNEQEKCNGGHIFLRG